MFCMKKFLFCTVFKNMCIFVAGIEANHFEYVSFHRLGVPLINTG